MSLLLRVDDFPGTKPDEFWKHNLENFKRFHHVFEKKNLRYVLGVIPGYTRPVDLQWLRDQENITVAMHGVVHDESKQDEFRDSTYLDIENAIHKSKDYLEAILETRVVDYIPPHNVVNADTVLALDRLGFEFVYGGPETDDEMKKFINMSGMCYVHSEPPLEYGRTDELMERGSIEHFKSLRDKIVDPQDPAFYCLTLHWTWEYNIGLEHLTNFLEAIR